MEPVHRTTIPVYPYDTSAFWDDFATMTTVQAASLNSQVALVIRVLMADEKYTQDKCEPYLVVHGVDMEGTPTPPIRLWRFGTGDLVEGRTYVMRGLKVVADRYWDDNTWQWMPRTDGRKGVECNFRTAAEDVTHVPSIVDIFPNPGAAATGQDAAVIGTWQMAPVAL